MSRNIVKVTDIEEVNNIIDEPTEQVKFVTPVRSRKDRKINKPSEPVKYIGTTPVKSRKNKNK